MFVSAVPTGLGFLIEAHPGLTPWAKIFRPAERDSDITTLAESRCLVWIIHQALTL